MKEQIIRRLIELKKTEETIFATIPLYIEKEMGDLLEQIDVNLKNNSDLYDWALSQFEQVYVEQNEKENTPISDNTILFPGIKDISNLVSINCPFCGSINLKNTKMKIDKKAKKCDRIKKIAKQFSKIILFDCKSCGKDFAIKKQLTKVKKDEAK